ncbi:hypothetical protein [Streptomyces sp. NBC_01500]|uniref:deoxynucleotide monophosphate kinase family protein n=1 Tax=Streptomyces sp. NBC_01500 TaxID=2903886 RepID=UPI002253781F|nr:hypothetical protein [Streptomyces sp. NBC_01500]MCX4547273.1 hypothetical protein [Streptomyces sp. NBC_01500]MCX4554193.1 hypothetical protein [Streptomyces sp. NBC_01500]MCX4554533.1 hypothetical protein [Streptomyces sp. NBC_01500]
MTYRNVAFIGKAQSGKDTAGMRLVQHWAFTRLAFADPLKAAALELDPIIDSEPYECDGRLYTENTRLSDLVRSVGWERAKEEYPEVRQTLQYMGQTVRELDPDFWVRVLMDKVRAADGWNMPVAVTDCRYRNEAEALRAAGFTLVRIARPRGSAMTMREIRAAKHASETELDDFLADKTLINDGSVFDLHTLTDALVRQR